MEGSVALGLKRDGGATILMRPGDKILVDNATNAVVRERFDCAHYISWRDGFHVFRHKTLGEIARDLERMFDVQIVSATRRCSARSISPRSPAAGRSTNCSTR